MGVGEAEQRNLYTRFWILLIFKSNIILGVNFILKNFTGEETKLVRIFKLPSLIKDTEHSSFLFNYKHAMFYQSIMSVRMGSTTLKTSEAFKCFQRREFQLYFNVELVESSVK